MNNVQKKEVNMILMLNLMMMGNNKRKEKENIHGVHLLPAVKSVFFSWTFSGRQKF